ncbi:TetR/AcrR family transcriptional regulator [Planotetraspora mira]|uniref:TetR family transcriptional regulator n=1 Tax=Planotetraspora mira TaxID=58121 RepID=A0A8J3TX12_9ACTN|nr:TetR/AcrR family transcriptional regulator [Planotetraspora mira]GII32907.1 TetR family transcriptional regulator [Planotetraspora mira]
MSPAPPRSGLREVTRRAVQAEIANTAMTLFVEQGYEETTIEQVAAAVGMSGRSVFRYFATKEDMVVGSMAQVGHDIAAALRTRPAEEPAWEALRRALDEPLRALNDDGGIALARSTLLTTTPALRAAQRQKHAQWNELLVPGITPRLEGSAASRQLQAEAIVAAALACLDVAVDEWTRSGGEKPLDELLDAAIAAVRG